MEFNVEELKSALIEKCKSEGILYAMVAVDRRTKDEAICLLCLLHKLIHSALKDTATGFAAGTTPDASGDRLISNLEDFCFDSIFFQSTRYLTQCRVGASLFVRASIQQQYLHIHSFFL